MSASKILRIGLMVVILATVVPFGAVDPFWFNLAALLNGLVFAATLAIPIRNLELLKVYRVALILIVSISAYLFFQSIHFPQNVFTNPIWETVRDLLSVRTGAISVDPAGTIATIPTRRSSVPYFHGCACASAVRRNSVVVLETPCTGRRSNRGVWANPTLPVSGFVAAK